MMKLTESYWPADRSVPLRDLTVGDLLREAAKDSPDGVGLGAGGAGGAPRVAGGRRPARALLARRASRSVGPESAGVGAARVRRRACRRCAGHGQPRVPAS